jgi:hypothetical protein
LLNTSWALSNAFASVFVVATTRAFSPSPRTTSNLGFGFGLGGTIFGGTLTIVVTRDNA